MAINLSKGQRISLTKTAPKLRHALLGLAWEPIKSEGFFSWLMGGLNETVDLDASCVCLDANGRKVDTVWFRKLASDDGAIHHSGDNRTGEADGDDETVVIDLAKVNPSVAALVLTINSYTRQSFERIKASSCRLVNGESKEELVKFALDAKGRHTALIMAALLRTSSGWEMAAIGEPGSGQTWEDLLPAITEWLSKKQGGEQ